MNTSPGPPAAPQVPCRGGAPAIWRPNSSIAFCVLWASRPWIPSRSSPISRTSCSLESAIGNARLLGGVSLPAAASVAAPCRWDSPTFGRSSSSGPGPLGGELAASSSELGPRSPDGRRYSIVRPSLHYWFGRRTFVTLTSMTGDDYGEPRVGTTLPLVALREQLAAARSRGESFGECWPATVKGVLAGVDPKARREWRECLERTRSTWEACFLRRSATPGEEALVAVKDMLEGRRSRTGGAKCVTGHSRPGRAPPANTARRLALSPAARSSQSTGAAGRSGRSKHRTCRSSRSPTGRGRYRCSSRRDEEEGAAPAAPQTGPVLAYRSRGCPGGGAARVPRVRPGPPQGRPPPVVKT